MSSGRFDRIRSTAAWRISIWTTVAFAIGTAIAFVLMFVVVKRDVQQRSDAWLGGEAEVLADVAAKTPRDDLYDRLVEEVAELASKEVPDFDGSSSHPDTVFFLIQRPGLDPLWVGPAPKENGVALGNSNVSTHPGIPASVSCGLARSFGRKPPFPWVLRRSCPSHDGPHHRAVCLDLVWPGRSGVRHLLCRSLSCAAQG
jgi:hypothetical protein